MKERSEFARDFAARKHQPSSEPKTVANGAVVLKAKDRRCPGCDGVGGAHKLLHCAYLLDDVKRNERGARA